MRIHIFTYEIPIGIILLVAGQIALLAIIAMKRHHSGRSLRCATMSGEVRIQEEKKLTNRILVWLMLDWGVFIAVLLYLLVAYLPRR